MDLFDLANKQFSDLGLKKTTTINELDESSNNSDSKELKKDENTVEGSKANSDDNVDLF